MALSRSERPRISPATKPLDTPVTKPKKVFFSVMAVAIQRLFSLRAIHLAKSPLNQPVNVGMQIISPLPDRKHGGADQRLPKQCTGGSTRPHRLRPLTNSSPSECQIC